MASVSDEGVPGTRLRATTEEDLPRLYEIQLDDTARHAAAFVDEASLDRGSYLAKFRRLLADDTITNRVVEVDGEVVGSVAAFPIEGDLEVTYWIHRDWWGRGVATSALAALLDEVTSRPIHARAVADNLGSVRVLERNGFVQIGSEEAHADGREATVTELVFRREV